MQLGDFQIEIVSGGRFKMDGGTMFGLVPKVLWSRYVRPDEDNNLDQDTRSRLIDILNGLELSYAIISHDWDFLDKTTQEVCAMERGRITRCERTFLHEHHHAHPAGDHPHHHGD